MVIVEMEMSDLEKVSQLAAQLGYPEPIEKIQTRFAQVKKLTTHQLYVAKNDENSVLGWILINKTSATILAEPGAEITALVVDESYQNKGVGAALIKKAEAWAKANELSLVRVRSNVIRTDAHRFYQRNGYSLKKSWHLFVKEL